MTLTGFKVAFERRYCQVLMGAGKRRKLVVTKDNIACPTAARSLGG